MRHGESTYNVLGLCNDDVTVPVPLTRNGRRQVAETAQRLRGAALELLLVSRLPRAQESARIVNRHHGAPLRVDRRLDDRRTGCEGRPVAEYLALRDADPLGFRGDGGETFAELKARVHGLLEDIAGLPAQRILVVSHHEVLQVVYGHFTGASDEAARRLPIANAGLLQYDMVSP